MNTATPTAPIDVTAAQTLGAVPTKLPHNLSVLRQDGKVIIIIDESVKSVTAKSGKPMLATSRGFIPILDGHYRLSLNLMDDRKV